MLLDVLEFLSRKAFCAVPRARWRRDHYALGGDAWTGRGVWLMTRCDIVAAR